MFSFVCSGVRDADMWDERLRGYSQIDTDHPEVECNRFIQIVEGEKEYKELKLRRLKLGAPR